MKRRRFVFYKLATKTVHLNNFKMVTNRTSVVLSSGEDTDKDNDNVKRKSNKMLNKRSFTGAGT